MPPNGPDCWPKEDSKKQWIVFYRLDDFTFTGIGTIEGNGEQWWDLPCKPHRVFNISPNDLFKNCAIPMDYFCHSFTLQVCFSSVVTFWKHASMNMQ